jgi:hypothetical protein
MEPGKWYAYAVTDRLADPAHPEIGNAVEGIGDVFDSVGAAVEFCWQYHLQHPGEGRFEVGTRLDSDPAYCDLRVEITYTGEGKWMRPLTEFRPANGEG